MTDEFSGGHPNSTLSAIHEIAEVIGWDKSAKIYIRVSDECDDCRVYWSTESEEAIDRYIRENYE